MTGRVVSRLVSELKKAPTLAGAAKWLDRLVILRNKVKLAMRELSLDNKLNAKHGRDLDGYQEVTVHALLT